MKKQNTQKKEDLIAVNSSPLGRAFALLDLFAHLGLVSVSDIVNMLKIPRPTVNRYLQSFEQLGLIQRSPYPGKYCLSAKMASLAHLMLTSTSAYAPIRSLLTGLSRRTGESANISVMSMGYVQFVVTSEAATRAQHIQSGMSVPLHTSAVGHVFLAGMSDRLLDQYLATGPWKQMSKYTITTPEGLRKKILQVRKDGYSINTAGYLEGIIGASVPIFDQDKNILAALGLYVSSNEKTEKDVIEMISTMRVYADRIGKILRE
ncbi:hypothetical protein W822_11310 [Advenella kashmirensis W13003]|uniref:IclR family transcriptional regulator n=1 Tax=Advenella kashmirensis W13003 TaxID=1424334 RepID=V8QW57_9BURK|nr:IclR family transcriptional regulator [Advenella kashmirensis]ETF03525.1 hypothetical protein W822_11310 [Advenella kashmirensis W13003]